MSSIHAVNPTRNISNRLRRVPANSTEPDSFVEKSEAQSSKAKVLDSELGKIHNIRLS